MQTCAALLRETGSLKKDYSTTMEVQTGFCATEKATNFTKTMYLLQPSTSEHDVFSVFDVLLDVKSPERFRTQGRNSIS